MASAEPICLFFTDWGKFNHFCNSCLVYWPNITGAGYVRPKVPSPRVEDIYRQIVTLIWLPVPQNSTVATRKRKLLLYRTALQDNIVRYDSWRVRQTPRHAAFSAGIFAVTASVIRKRFGGRARVGDKGLARRSPRLSAVGCRGCRGSILECRCGLSTILLGIIARGRVSTKTIPIVVYSFMQANTWNWSRAVTAIFDTIKLT